MSILSLDASQSVKLTLMKDVSHCFIRSDKLGRRRDVLVVFHDTPEGYTLPYFVWLSPASEVIFRWPYPRAVPAGAGPTRHSLSP